MRFFLSFQSFIGSILTLGMLGLSDPIFGQDAGAAAAVASTPAKPSAFQSSGLSASISSIAIVQQGRQAVLQVALQNITKYRIYLLAFGSNKSATDIGLFGAGENDSFSGINHCTIYNRDDSYSYSQCLTDSDGIGKDIEKYSYIEPGDFIAVSVKYKFDQDISHAKSISFALKMIVRNANADVDALPEADAEKSIGRPHMVNINFPLIPFKDKE